MARSPRPANRDPQLIVSKPKDTSSNLPAGNVDYVHPKLQELTPLYDEIRDCIAGQPTIKAKKTKYLPMPNDYDQSYENQSRYAAYLLRAVFYNVVKRTLAGLVGQVYAQAPVIQVPPLLDPVIKDINGAGVTAEQQSKAALSYVVSMGRAGLLADYPQKSVPTTRAEQKNGDVRPTLTLYEPWNVINWRTTVRGSKRVLTLVVLKETYDKEDDGFETKIETQYRVLRLVGGIYTVEIWREGTEGDGYRPRGDLASAPVDARGNFLTEIPFKFIGVENNDPLPDDPPMYDMAALNVAHYRNSADYEEAVFVIGQPTPWFAGLSEQWVNDVFKGRVELGSRAAIPLPEGGSAGLLQVQENSMAKEAMEMKERQMVALGAKLVEQKSVQRTATEASQEQATETSTLVTATKNVSAAYQWCLEWCAIFVGALTEHEDAVDAENKKVKFELNTELGISKMSPEQIKATIEAWVKEAITTVEMRKRLRQTGLAFQSDEEYDKYAEEKAKEDEERARKQFAMETGGDEDLPDDDNPIPPDDE